MKSALAVLLLALVPLSSLRMVCVTSHDLVVRISEAEAAAREAEACARICKHHVAQQPSPAPSPAVRCLLVADPTCEYLTTAVAAVLPAAPTLVDRPRLVAIPVVLFPHYSSPATARPTPPPKADA